MENFQLIHNSSETIIAQGTSKDVLKSFEGNYYIKTKYFNPDLMKTNYIPGLCFSSLFVWMGLILPDGKKLKNVGWKYFLPNPIFYIVIGRIGMPQNHPELSIRTF